jgi:predicted permease
MTRAFGHITRVREDMRTVWLAAWFEHAGQDLRYAARRLRRAPVFACVTILILSAGIGLNLGFFQMINVVVLQPLRVADVSTLVRFDRITKQFSSNGFPYPATQFIRKHNDVLSAVLTSTASEVVWGDDLNDRVSTLYVSANWFTELGYHAAPGRVFSEAVDERPDAAPVVVISHEFWRTRFKGEAAAGRAVRVNTRPATIVGVAPPGFPGLRLGDTKVWLLIHQLPYFNPGSAFREDWRSHNTQLYARLRAGVSPSAAQDGLRATIAELAHARPTEYAADEVLQPYLGSDGFRGPRERAKLRTMTVLVGCLMLLVLLVACANLSSLIFSHSIGRLREFSVRTALGATASRLLRQQLVESALLAASGAAGGLITGYWFASFIGVQTALPHHVDLAPDWRMILAGIVVAFIATLAIGFVPAWMVSKGDLVSVMKDGGSQTSRGLAHAKFRLVLIASQVAGCCVLLIVAGSMIVGMQRMLAHDLGFEFRHIAVLDAELGRYNIAGEAARQYWEDVKQTLSANPGVERVALASHSPLGGSGGRSRYNDAQRLIVTAIVAEPELFELLRIPMLAGRTFQANDQSSNAIIISRRLAMEMYGTLDVVGRGFPRSNPERTIVGVAADAPLVNVTATNVAEQYVPPAPSAYGGLALLVRARANPERLLMPMRDAARLRDERVLPKTSLVLDQYEKRVHDSRIASLVASLMGLLALGLACSGIFGLVAHTVATRTKEIGIRRALGADGASVLRLVVRQLVIPIVLGVSAGAVSGVLMSRVLEGEPFYLPATSVAMPAAALALFSLTAVMAAVGPAVRALRADPVRALRHD